MTNITLGYYVVAENETTGQAEIVTPVFTEAYKARHASEIHQVDERTAGKYTNYRLVAALGDTYTPSVEEARSLITLGYYDYVDSLTEELVEYAETSGLTTLEELSDRLHEIVGDSNRVVYENRAIETLLVSCNYDAWKEASLDHEADYTDRAYYALLADVKDSLKLRWKPGMKAETRKDEVND